MFLKESTDHSLFKDGLFAVSTIAIADEDPNKINATVGSLYDEEGKLVTFNTVYETLKSLPNAQIAKYASQIPGNPDFIEECEKFVYGDSIKLYKRSVATTGGTGALNLAIKDCLEPGDTMLIPSQGWTSYVTIAKEYAMHMETYNPFDVDDIINQMDKVSKENKKLFILINSPCHNPSGISYTIDEWTKIINKLNEISNNIPVILLNDIAYIDFGFSKEYFKLFNNINDNVLVFIGYSLSKAFTAYGQRLGMLTFINSSKEVIDDIHNTMTKSCRAVWSNVNNGLMTTFVKVMKERKEEYLKELHTYRDLLRDRASLFKKELDEENMEYYRYVEGFFITLKVNDNETRDKIHQRLLDDHVYTVKVDKGIRVGVCSLPKDKIKGLAKRIKKSY